MNKNPSIIIVSLVTGALISRTTFAEFVRDNADAYAPSDVEAMADELATAGFAKTDHHVLVDATPTDADVLKFISDKKDANADVLTELILTTNGCGFVACGDGVSTASSKVSADIAIAALRKTIPSPAELIERKREAARQLIAEAEAIVAKHQPALAAA